MTHIFLALVALTIFGTTHSAFAEFCSAKDMQKECRVALDVLQGKAEKNFKNARFTGECIAYVQGAVDAAQAMAENFSWYKLCMPENVSTLDLIQKFIAFVDRNPKYILASTSHTGASQ